MPNQPGALVMCIDSRMHAPLVFFNDPLLEEEIACLDFDYNEVGYLKMFKIPFSFVRCYDDSV